MTAERASSEPRELPSAVDLDARRQATWLLSRYSDPTWVVASSNLSNRTCEIEFDMRLADGTSLLQADRLCATVREYAWWVRDPRFSRVDDANTHANLVRNLAVLAHALTLRNIWSFAHMQPYDVQRLVEECRFGNDAVLHASERVAAYLKAMSEANSVAPKPFGGLPRYVNPVTGEAQNLIYVSEILRKCNLPYQASKLRRVSAVMSQAASTNGLATKRSQRFEDLPEPANVTQQALQRTLAPLEQLYAMRRKIEADSISFKPFPRGAGRVAAVKGVGAGRTSTVPPMLVMHLLERSTRWLLNHDERQSTMSMGLPDVLYLATACWILVAAFTARRHEEINDLREGCLRGDDASGWWLHVHIEKTLQRKEWIPVPGIVARAVETLSSISEAARETTGTDLLLQWIGPGGKTVRLDVGRRIDDFAAAVGTPDHRPRGGTAAPWHWHPHQFRRFFAILYFYRFEGATIEALSHHLRHFSLEMTRRYVTEDPEAAALWTDTEWGYLGHVAWTIVSGERAVSGAAGERLKKTAQRLVDVFRRRLQVASPERVGASLAMMMERQGLVLTPKPWVTCSCPRTRDAAAKAGCRRDRPDGPDAIGPDFAHAGPAVCAACPHAIIEGSKAGYVGAEVAHLEAASASGARAGTMFGFLEQARVVEVSEARDRRWLGAAPVSRAATDTEVGA